MSEAAIVTDSTANLPASLVERYGIHIVPTRLIFGQQSFRDGIDITPAQFYERLAQAPELPTTSQPSTGDFLEVYTRLSKQTDCILSIHLSDLLSGTIRSALAARELMSDVRIKVIDSRSASLGLGFIAMAAARASRDGKSFDDVVGLALDLVPKINVIFVVDTLKYLHMGGRIGAASTLLGTALKIKPLLHLSEGQVNPLERVRSKSRATDRMLEIMAQSVDGKASGRVLRAAVAHAARPDEAAQIEQEILSRFHPLELYLTELTPVIGAHVGPGTLGIGWYLE